MDTKNKWNGQILCFQVYALKHSMGHWCGYIRVPKTHPWYGISYMSNFCNHSGCSEHTPEYNIEVHGGLTFSGKPFGKKVGHWFGFDCAHSRDTIPNMPEHKGDTYKDLDYVKKELLHLAEQLNKVKPYKEKC